MASSRLILLRYASALHALSHERGITETIEAELVDLEATLFENPELRRQLDNPRLGREVKRSVMRQLMGEGVSDLLRRTVLLLVDKGRAGLLGEFTGVFNEVAMQASGRQIAHVTSAAALDDASRTALRLRLEQITGQSISLSETVDDGLLGGLSVVIGSRMIDGSLKRRLQDLSNKMLQVPLAPNAAGN
jgi:F-type H+-transporting ATPase subunit delta